MLIKWNFIWISEEDELKYPFTIKKFENTDMIL
uniref:Uncharacterized protein n=1 Tax=Octopus bimaculoides TaxID=37653 RepID=A0A0L8GJY1_OCTBM